MSLTHRLRLVKFLTKSLPEPRGITPNSTLGLRGALFAISFIVPSPPTQIKRCFSCEIRSIDLTYSVASPTQVV